MKKTDGFHCGFIGLGSQGAPIARKMINSGLPMTLWARRPEALVDFRDTGASLAMSIPELGACVNYVAVCVSGDNGVSEVSEALIDNLRPGSFLVIHSTVLPSTVQHLGKRADARQISLIDAPVSGGGPAAARGDLTVMTGGDSSSISRIRPVLECFSGKLFHLGDVGAAQSAKLINNALMAATMGLSGCAADLGRESGLDVATLLRVLADGSSRSFALEVLGRHENFQSMAFTATLQEKIALLGEVLGMQHPTYRTFKAAAERLSKIKH